MWVSLILLLQFLRLLCVEGVVDCVDSDVADAVEVVDVDDGVDDNVVDSVLFVFVEIVVAVVVVVAGDVDVGVIGVA